MSGENYFSFVTRRRGRRSDRNGFVVDPVAVKKELDTINGIATSLLNLRMKADCGDVKSMYEANLQIESLMAARRRIEDMGGRVRFNSSTCLYELV